MSSGKKGFIAALWVVLALVSGNLQANGAWEVMLKESGVTLEKRMVPGKPYRQVRGHMMMSGSIESLLTILENPAYCARWLNDCRQSKTVQQISPNERIDYTVMDAPLFLEDRDVYIRSKATYDSQHQTITVAMQGVENFAENHPGRVRVLDLQGYWRFQQVDEQQVKVDYLMYNNPQVTPISAVNSSKPQGIFNTFNNLRALANSAQFRHATIPAARLQAMQRR